MRLRSHRQGMQLAKEGSDSAMLCGDFASSILLAHAFLARAPLQCQNYPFLQILTPNQCSFIIMDKHSLNSFLSTSHLFFIYCFITF